MNDECWRVHNTNDALRVQTVRDDVDQQRVDIRAVSFGKTFVDTTNSSLEKQRDCLLRNRRNDICIECDDVKTMLADE